MNQASPFGVFVRQRRRELDLTQDELARRVGCAAITLRKIGPAAETAVVTAIFASRFCRELTRLFCCQSASNLPQRRCARNLSPWYSRKSLRRHFVVYFLPRAGRSA